MKTFIVAVLSVLGYAVYKKADDFFSKNVLMVVDKDDVEPFLEENNLESNSKNTESMDLRGTPTHECVCGSVIWKVHAQFDDYQIAQYFLDMECAKCGSLATAPTPLDREKME
jgi:hypothetical protein